MMPRPLQIAALLGAVALPGCSRQNPPAPAPVAASSPLPAPPPSPRPTAAVARVHGLELGNAVDTDRRVTRPMRGFSPRDTTLHAVVSIGSSDPTVAVAGTLGAKWTHIDSSQTVLEERKDIVFAGDDVTDFRISKPDGWPIGRYKVEIALDGNVVQTREFEVK